MINLAVFQFCGQLLNILEYEIRIYNIYIYTGICFQKQNIGNWTSK